MRTNPFLIALAIVVIFCQCKATKKIVVDTKTITIEYSEAYCGGAAPPPELLSEIAKLRPMANKEVEVYIGSPSIYSPKKYKTDSLGRITLPVNLANQVFINLYPSADAYKSESGIYECYKKFIERSLLTVDMTSAEKEFKFIQVLQCNPCLPAAP